MATLPFPNVLPSSISFGIKYNTQINVSTLSGAVQTIEIPGARWVANVSFDNLEPFEGRVLAAFLAELRGASGRFYLKDFSHANPRGANTAGTVTVDVTQNTVQATGTATGTQTSTTLQDTGKTFITTGAISVKDYIHNATVNEWAIVKSFTENTITIEGTWVTTPTTGVDTYNIYKFTNNSINTTGWTGTVSDQLLPGDYIEVEGPELKMVIADVDSTSGDATITFDPPLRIPPTHASTVATSDCRAVMVLDNDENRWQVNNAGLLSNISFGCMEAY